MVKDYKVGDVVCVELSHHWTLPNIRTNIHQEPPARRRQ